MDHLDVGQSSQPVEEPDRSWVSGASADQRPGFSYHMIRG
jgi:hypothetical protein